MSLEQGFNIIDSALDLALSDLEKRGMPKDEAQIALLIRLNSIVPPEVLKVTELLMDDGELTATQKVRRKAIVEIWGDLIEELYP